MRRTFQDYGFYQAMSRARIFGGSTDGCYALTEEVGKDRLPQRRDRILRASPGAVKAANPDDEIVSLSLPYHKQAPLDRSV